MIVFKGIERSTTSTRGKLLGFAKGLDSTKLQDFNTALKATQAIYTKILQKECSEQIDEIKEALSQGKDIKIIDHIAAQKASEVTESGSARLCLGWALKAYLEEQ